MAMKTALSQSRVVTMGVLLGVIWLVVTAFSVFDEMSAAGEPFVGQSMTAGVIGLLAMLGIFALLVTLFGELGSEGPAPEPWE
ncbi:hypothetical protein [Natronomonas sp. EA1]|uniref:hypothetical protein n=1 Tax=Natronomonas sp. EA1 TaxID=3421655 RepID=UPI003EBEDC39